MLSNKYLSALVCGFGAAVLTTIPGIKSIGCCLIVPFAAGFSIFLYRKTSKIKEKIYSSDAFLFGFLTGLIAAFFATFFDVLMTYITHTNEFVDTLPQTEMLLKKLNLGAVINDSLNMMRKIAKDIKTNGFSLFYTVGMLFSYGIIYSIFGILGGFLGMTLLNKKKGV